MTNDWSRDQNIEFETINAAILKTVMIERRARVLAAVEKWHDFVRSEYLLKEYAQKKSVQKE